MHGIDHGPIVSSRSQVLSLMMSQLLLVTFSGKMSYSPTIVLVSLDPSMVMVVWKSNLHANVVLNCSGSFVQLLPWPLNLHKTLPVC